MIALVIILGVFAFIVSYMGMAEVSTAEDQSPALRKWLISVALWIAAVAIAWNRFS